MESAQKKAKKAGQRALKTLCEPLDPTVLEAFRTFLDLE